MITNQLFADCIAKLKNKNMTAFEKYSANYENGMNEALEKVSSIFHPQIKTLMALSDKDGQLNGLQACMMAYHREMKDMVKRIDEQFEIDKAQEQEMTVKINEN